jgi:hypothetical protein
MKAAQRMEEYLQSLINMKETELISIEGELSALRSNLAALRNFREEEKKQEAR